MKQVLYPKTIFTDGKTSKFANNESASPIGFVYYDAPDTFLNTSPTKDFIIMYRNGTRPQVPTAIEVDYETLTIVKSDPQVFAAKSKTFICPAGELGKTYTVNFVKHGVNRHERNLWRISVTLKNDCTSVELTDMLLNEYRKLRKGNDDFGYNVIFERNVVLGGRQDVIKFYQLDHKHSDHYDIQLTDGLSGIQVSSTGSYVIPTFDKDDVNNLLSEGAANRGANYRYEEGATIYPGFETFDGSTDIISVYTLRFATNRKSAKTRDELVWQLVHIIVNDDIDTVIQPILDGIKSST